MSSSSTDRPRRSFWSVDRAGLIRLGVAVALAVAALVSPHVGSTSAQFTDSTEVSITFTVTPTPTPEP
ncbi:hypothetical protein HP550_00535 [Cellulomonas humilata]|uniref:Uncharacterized protein n=1 Tax=Cellulomonas humilata TaxID=144055 RepID=A0A7Y5ZX50_9CELL|nr:hypothetical protein [Cellulomonas humilata]NUU15736.1 hypothetical protein [Cellulomonas humilata]